MKKLSLLLSLILCMSLLLCGCFPKIMIIPDNDTIGQPKTFQKAGLTITLTEAFVETESQLGFDAYYVADFCGVVVLKEEFSLEEGLAERPLDQYIKNVIANNGHRDVEPQNRDGLWFYISDSGTARSYSYSFKGSDAFYIVQFLCRNADAPVLEDLFFLWACSVEVE